VGLIQREIEKAGISTIGISIVRSFSEKIKPPRTVFVGWPFGHPLGEPFNVAQQRTVLMEAFAALYSIETPGGIVDLPYRWKKESYRLYKATQEIHGVRKPLKTVELSGSTRNRYATNVERFNESVEKSINHKTISSLISLPVDPRNS